MAEPSEPLAPGATVWYEYTAPSGSAGVLSLGGGQDIAVFTGTALANLQQVVSGSVFVQVNATPGTKYFVQISNRTSTTQAGQFTLSWSWNTAPANDDFANAQELTGTSGSVNGTTLGATVETGEPNASENTVWYAYTAPSSSVGALSIVLANQAGSANVYSEGSGGALTLVQPTSHSTDYETTPGTTYAIQVQPSYGIPDNFTLNWSWTAAPANDNLANAQVLTGNSGQVNGTDVAATLESGEKNVYFGSVWYQYTAPSSPSGILTVSLNSPGGEFFNVYTASSVANWTPVASPSTSSDTPGTTFATTAGTTYDIQVGAGQYEDLASFTLTWSWNAIANNDNFANAEAISGVSGSVNGTTVGSTVETGEPNATLDSVWYQYTAPSASSGNLLVEWGGVQNLNVYTGTSVSSLTPVTTTMIDGGDLFATTPGAVYYFQVWATAASGENAFDLTWLWTVPPPNDNFAQAQPISGPSGSVTGTTVGATVEPNEPYGYEKSVWYAYTTPSNASGQITFSVTGSGFASPTWFDVYTGPSLANLSLVTTSLSGSALFTPVPGTTYHLQLEGSAASTGSFTMTWALPGVPANDNFAKAQALTGASGTVNGSTVNSTIEPGDPNAAGGDNSVWYSYTDSSTTGGSLNLTAPNSGDAICVYTGTSLSNLTEVAGGFGLANLTTSPGVAYYVEVMSPEDYVGPFSLAWSWTANPGAQSSSRDQGATLALPAKKPSGHSA